MANTPYYTKAEVEAKNQQTFNEIKQVTEAISAGEGGKLYDTLADAQALDPKPVDGTVFQVSKITDAVNAGVYTFQSGETGGIRFERSLIEKKYISQLVDTFFQGGLNTSDGSSYLIGNRIRTDFIEVTDNTTINIDSGYLFNLFEYDEAKNYIQHGGGWHTGGTPFDLQENTSFIRILVGRVDDSDISVDAVVGLNILYPDAFVTQSKIKEKVKDVLNDPDDFIFSVDSFFGGGLKTSDGSVEPRGNRINTDFIEVTESTTVDINSGYLFNLFEYDEAKNYIQHGGGWHTGGTPFDLQENTSFIRILVKRVDDSDISVDAVVGLMITVKDKYLKKSDLINDNDADNTNKERISIVGDSISTGNNAVELTVLASDVNTQISAHVTQYDVNAGLTIGGYLVQSSDVGVLTTFTPTSEDIGKQIGIAPVYNSLSYNQLWWGIAANSLGWEVVQNVSWSGSSLTSHENSGNTKGAHAWSQGTINKLKKRDAEGNYVLPTVIVIYRGTNDFSHGVGAIVDGEYNASNAFIPDTDLRADGQYGFKEGLAITIQKYRQEYPFAKIVLCTLNNFKRKIVDEFPVRNGNNTLIEFNNAIREVADILGCHVIEFDKSGITWENMYPTYISDSETTPTHPNATGHAKMAERAIKDLKTI